VHGAGIIAMGYLMELLYSRTGSRTVKEFALGLELLKGKTAWTSGEWKLSETEVRAWERHPEHAQRYQYADRLPCPGTQASAAQSERRGGLTARLRLRRSSRHKRGPAVIYRRSMANPRRLRVLTVPSPLENFSLLSSGNLLAMQ